MDYPKTLSMYSEAIEKPFDAFTLEDWRNAAIFASRQLEKALFPPKKREAADQNERKLQQFSIYLQIQ